MIKVTLPKEHRSAIIASILIVLSFSVAMGVYMKKWYGNSELRSLQSLASLIDAGQYDLAERDLRDLIEKEPDNIRSYLLLASLQIEKLARSRHQEKDSKEILLLLNIIDKHAKSSESKRLRATVAYILNQSYGTKKYASEAVAIDSGNDKAWSLLGLSAEKDSNFKLAQSYYDVAYKKNQSNVEAILGQARMLRQDGDRIGGIAKAEQAIGASDKRLEKAKAYYTLGHFKSADHEYGKAIPDFKQSVSLSNNDYAPHGELAYALYMSYVLSTSTKDIAVLESALPHALASVKLNPEYSYGYYFAHKIYAKLGKSDISKKYLEFALKYAKKADKDKAFVTRISKELNALSNKSK